ncbi:hypothetical protein [Hoeflea sp. TYP-13]|uniref:hypothetical protein n=1 Tax=Hoeflea sp. TYP-13 TaxID=3230023 RepID=UPI0034C62C03
MDNQFWMPLFAALVAASVTTTGIAVISRFQQWGQNRTAYFASFAAGILFSVSFCILLRQHLQKTQRPRLFVDRISADASDQPFPVRMRL